MIALQVYELDAVKATVAIVVAELLVVVVVPPTVHVPDTVPEIWLAGRDREESVVRVALDDAEIFAALPAIFPVT